MRSVKRVNVFSIEAQYDEGDPEGYNAGYKRLGPEIGAARMGATIYELRAGQSICPYHYEFPDEEWAIVLEGAPTLRHPEGEDELAPGDTVCFPPGPDGAHKLTNDGEVGDRRVLRLAGAVGHHDRVAARLREPDRLDRLRQRPDLVHLDEDGVGDAALDPLTEALGVRDEEIVADELDAVAELGRQLLPGVPVVLGATVLDRDDGIRVDDALPEGG